MIDLPLLRFEILNNRAAEVGAALRDRLPAAGVFWAAIGYFHESGYEEIAAEIEALLARGGDVRLLLGSTDFDERTSRLLVRLLNHPSGLMVIRKYADRSAFLHSKLYVLQGTGLRTLVFGSSNLTHGGMASNVEFNAAEDYDPSVPDPKWDQITAWFDDLWNQHALPLSEDDLRVIRKMAARGESPDQPHQPVEPVQPEPEPPAEPWAAQTSYADHFMALQLRYLTLPLAGRVEPFWFQMQSVERIVRAFDDNVDRRGLMVAHEVGLGKTIVAGLAVKELLGRGRIRRMLVVCPESVVRQWQDELREKLDESFEVLDGKTRQAKGAAMWSAVERGIVSYDFLKANVVQWDGARRRWVVRQDWPAEAQWDFLILDESHFVKNHRSMRYAAVAQLVGQLNPAGSFTLLLTATPIQNDELELYTQLALVEPNINREQPTESDMRLLRPEDWETIRREAILRKLRREQDIKGLFPDRITSDIEKNMSFGESLLYLDFERYIAEESAYYRLISAQAQTHPGAAVGRIIPFIKMTYLREFCSSSEAFIQALVGDDRDCSLEVEWRTLPVQEGLGGVPPGGEALARRMGLKGRILLALCRGYIDLYAQETDLLQRLQDVLPDLEFSQDPNDPHRVYIELQPEQRAELEAEAGRLNEFARRAAALAPFAKERGVVERVLAILRQGRRKIVLFTAFLPTGRTLARRLAEAGIPCAFFEGGLDDAERARLVDRFWGRRGREEEIDVLVATDAGGVGLNLQIANHVINWDLSWNPMVVEQRIGRVQRLGQLSRRIFVDNWFAQTDPVPFAERARARGEPFDRERHQVQAVDARNLYDRLKRKIELIKAMGIACSDEVIADALLRDEDLAEAEIRYRARRLSEEEYQARVQRVLERQRDRLRELEGLDVLASVVDEAARRRAEEQAIVFDRYLDRLFRVVSERLAEGAWQENDVFIITTPPGFGGELLPQEHRVTLDREVANRLGQAVSFFGLRHPLARAALDLLLPEANGGAPDAGEASDTLWHPPTRRTLGAPRQDPGKGDPLRWEFLAELLQPGTRLYQVNVLVRHQVRRGEGEPQEVNRLLSLLVYPDGRVVRDEDPDSTDPFLQVEQGKMALLPATESPLDDVLPEAVLQTVQQDADAEVDRQVAAVNEAHQRELNIRLHKRINEVQQRLERIISDKRGVEEQIERLERGRRSGPDYEAERADLAARHRRLTEEHLRLDDELTDLTVQVEGRYQDTLTHVADRLPPQIISFCELVVAGVSGA